MKLPTLSRRAKADAEGASPKPAKKRRISKKLVIPVVACLLVGAAGVHFLGGSQTAAAADLTYTTAAVERRDITAQIIGSGTLAAADSYSVSTLLEGVILTADFQEGDQVEEGTVLYTIDDSDAANSLEQAQISLNQSERSYQHTMESLEDLTITAPVSGQVWSIDVDPGDEVAAGQQVASIRDARTMTLEVYFPADDAASFKVYPLSRAK